MFEEVCLVCGKHLHDNGRAYCGDECESADTTSPSISSASSVLSSPQMGYSQPGDVPALIPSALGTALRNSRRRTRHSPRHSISSSSVSSTSWSLITDYDEDHFSHLTGNEYSYHEVADPVYDGSSKSANFAMYMRPSALSYARRPSSTNGGSTVPDLNRRTSSGSSSDHHVRGIPRSAPNNSHSSTEDEAYSDFGFSSRDEFDANSDEHPDQREIRPDSLTRPKQATASTKKKRPHNRASLPAYFSLLQITSPGSEKRSSPKSASSGHTIARASPPTPKLSVAGLAIAAQTQAGVQTTPRGRRRVPEEYKVTNEDSQHHYPPPPANGARSPSPQAINTKTVISLQTRVDSKGSVEQVFDWSSASGLARGRTAARRNSSPPPKMMLSAIALSEHAVPNKRETFTISAFGGRSTTKPRGRARAEELDGLGMTAEAPGYGNGRSGLLARERGTSGRNWPL